MNASIAQARHLLSLSQRILDGLDDTHRAVEPQPGIKTAGWIVGHLAVTADFARRLCGRSAICPAEWRPVFNPGSEPSHDPAHYPSMIALCEAFRLVYADLVVAACDADPASLAADNPYAPARADFASAGDFVAYIVSGHLAYHLGQLVAWRAAAGMGRVSDASTLGV